MKIFIQKLRSYSLKAIKSNEHMAKFSRKSISVWAAFCNYFFLAPIYRTFVKHVYLHIQFVKRNFLDHRVKKPSLPLLNFKTGHFALRREENIVEFLEGRFRNQQL